MKRCSLFLFVVVSMARIAFAADLPQFADYPATGVHQGKNVPVRLTTPEARQFRTRLTEAAGQPPNFAGHCILTQWGCGSGCIQPAIIDAKRGRVFMVPFTVTTVGEEIIDPVQFERESRLFIVNGSRNEQPEHGSFYYLWDGRGLKLIRTVDRSR